MAQMATPQGKDRIFTVRHPYGDFQIKASPQEVSGWTRRNIVNRSPIESLFYEEYSRHIPTGTRAEEVRTLADSLKKALFAQGRIRSDCSAAAWLQHNNLHVVIHRASFCHTCSRNGELPDSIRKWDVGEMVPMKPLFMEPPRLPSVHLLPSPPQISGSSRPPTPTPLPEDIPILVPTPTRPPTPRPPPGPRGTPP